MAAHEAAETVPLHNAKGARDSAVSMLRTLMQEAVGGVAPVSTTIIEPHLPSVPVEPHSSPAKLPYASSPIKPLLTPGVSLIEGRMTGNAIIKQFDAARQQPKDVDFDGSAENVVVERSFGDDIAGTAVRNPAAPFRQVFQVARNPDATNLLEEEAGIRDDQP